MTTKHELEIELKHAQSERDAAATANLALVQESVKLNDTSTMQQKTIAVLHKRHEDLLQTSINIAAGLGKVVRLS